MTTEKSGYTEAVAAVCKAAREVDRHLDPKNVGEDRLGRWRFGGARVDAEASIALLILHDCLNDLEHSGGGGY